MPMFMKKRLRQKTMDKARAGKHNEIDFIPGPGVFVKRTGRGGIPAGDVQTRKVWSGTGLRATAEKTVTPTLRHPVKKLRKEYDHKGRLIEKKITKEY
ncbi:MAG: hypothetical protein ABH986_01935 [archaeon]